jgi:hypothetical protein
MTLGSSDDNEFMQLLKGPQVDATAFIRQLATWADGVREKLDPKDGFILNLWDELSAKIYRAKYKIENLH